MDEFSHPRPWASARLTIFGVGLALLVAWALRRGGGPSSGVAPDFTVPDQYGTPVSLSTYAGKVVVLNFWATWCGPCQSEMPELADFHHDHPDVVLLGVSVDRGASAKRLSIVAKDLGVDWRVLSDTRGLASSAYGVSAIPVTVVVDKHGNIAARTLGGTTEAWLADKVAKLK